MMVKYKNNKFEMYQKIIKLDSRHDGIIRIDAIKNPNVLARFTIIPRTTSLFSSFHFNFIKLHFGVL